MGLIVLTSPEIHRGLLQVALQISVRLFSPINTAIRVALRCMEQNQQSWFNTVGKITIRDPFFKVPVIIWLVSFARDTRTKTKSKAFEERKLPA